MNDDQIGTPFFNYDLIEQRLSAITEESSMRQVVVNAPFSDRLTAGLLFLGIVVLLVLDEKNNVIDRVALSQTELAKNTQNVSAVPFNQIKIPANHPENIIAAAIRTNTPKDTTDWYYLFTPALSSEDARLNQASGGIAYSAVYPLRYGTKKAAMIFSYFQYEHNIGESQRVFMRTYSELVSKYLAKF